MRPKAGRMFFSRDACSCARECFRWFWLLCWRIGADALCKIASLCKQCLEVDELRGTWPGWLGLPPGSRQPIELGISVFLFCGFPCGAMACMLWRTAPSCIAKRTHRMRFFKLTLPGPLTRMGRLFGALFSRQIGRQPRPGVVKRIQRHDTHDFRAAVLRASKAGSSA